MAKIKSLTNRDGEVFYPLTHTDAVLDKQGKSVSTRFSELEKNTNEKLTEVEAETNAKITELEQSKVDKESIAQKTGDSETEVMSQKAVTEKLTELESVNKKLVGAIATNLLDFDWVSVYVDDSGVIRDSNASLSCIIEMADGDVLRVETRNNKTSILSYIDAGVELERGNTVSPIITITDNEIHGMTYISEGNNRLVICLSKTSYSYINIRRKENLPYLFEQNERFLSSQIFEKVKPTLDWISAYVETSRGLILQTQYSSTSQPIALHKGDIICVRSNNPGTCVISKTTKGLIGLYEEVEPIVYNSGVDYYEYLADTDCEVVVCVNNADVENVFIRRNDALESKFKKADTEPSEIIQEISSKILSFNSDKLTIVSLNANGELMVCGKNLLKEDTLVKGKILNDNGVETVDSTSAYYAHYIPVIGGKVVSSNTELQRVYYYDENKLFIARSGLFNKRCHEVPNIVNGSQVAWAQVQVSKVASASNVIVSYGTIVENYEPHLDMAIDSLGGHVNIFSENLDKITLRFNSEEYRVEKALSIPSVTEPSLVDEGYSTPRAQERTLRELWTAANKYYYISFLSNYYDKYRGESESGYRVRKCSLGNDCSKLGYEVMCYEFKPATYNKTILLSAGMNSNETSTIWGLATFIREMMESQDEVYRYYKNNIRFVVIPIICPSSFDQEPLRYPNYNNVRINKNFNYDGSWARFSADTLKGEYPDSEAETQILKKWLNDYASIADCWIDCHSNPFAEGNPAEYMTLAYGSNADVRERLQKASERIRTFYVNKGYCTENAIITITDGANTFPKTIYADVICNIPSVMIEQQLFSTAYGSDGNTNNDSYGIKNYVTMLRQYVGAMIEGEDKLVV